MTSSFLPRRGPAWIRYWIAVVCILLSANVSSRSGCDDGPDFVVLLPAVGLLMLCAALSFVLSVITARHGWREALAEFGVGILMLFSIFLMVVAARLSAPGTCL
jgi:hypothetical protein